MSNTNPKFSLDSLNTAQKEAALASRDPLLIVAGAGTGKTKTLTERVALFLQEGIALSGICALTFTNKAAREMLDRIRSRIGNYDQKVKKEGEPFIGTFHSLGARILRREAVHVGRNPNFVIFDNQDSFQLVKKIVKREFSGDKSEKPAHYHHKISSIKNGLDDFEGKDYINEKLALVFDRYETALKDNNAFDFDDLVGKVVLIFQKKKQVLDKYRNRFLHVFVDEYQDINSKQYELIKLLNPKGSLSVVGDDQQTIYSWRGSRIETFLNFKNDWPKTRVVFLDQNFRSTKNIIDSASEVIEKNILRMKRGEGERGGRLWTENKEGDKVVLRGLGSEEEEAEWLAQKISENWEKAATLGVLYRTNAQSRAIETALLERGIPYAVYGGVRFYERLEIRDIVAALRIVLNPQDEVSRDRLTKNIGKSRLEFFLDTARTERDDLKPEMLIKLFIKNTNYFEILERTQRNLLERQENIAELIGFASQFESLSEFLEKIALLEQVEKATSKRGAGRGKHAQLMTIHLAKGLEFDAVWVAGLAEGVLPHYRSLERLDELEEERRLLYVAMTRARKKLSLSFYDIPSRFLSDVPEELIELEGADRNWVDLDDEERYITVD